jgi:3',5'-cyclic AMP phosphodiesterase CpdA
VACLEFSPHELPDGDHEKDLHAKGVERLLSQPPIAPLQFAVVGDTQLHFDDAQRLVDDVNRRGGSAFVVQVGDLTHVGLSAEYSLMNDVFRDLRTPYFVAIGNHDHLGSGDRAFTEMFGPHDFAFTYARTRFVFVDTNAPEFGFDGTAPDLAWLAEQLAPKPDFDRAVVFAHIGPDSSDFDPSLVEAFVATLRDANVAVSFHGHLHTFGAYERDGVRYYTAAHVKEGTYLWVTEGPGGNLDVEVVSF